MSVRRLTGTGANRLDRAGLSGVHGISVFVASSDPSCQWTEGEGGDASDMWDPPVTKTLEEQVGLRLESVGKVSAEYLEIDQLEKDGRAPNWAALDR